MTSERRRLRVSIDTKVFESSMMSGSGPTSTTVQAAYRGDLSIVMSREQRVEITTVVQRPQLQRFFSEPDVHMLLNLLSVIELHVHEEQSPVTVRDPKDEHILAAAVAGNADFLVSGDEDLLVLADHPPIAPLPITTPRQFVELEQFDG